MSNAPHLSIEDLQRAGHFLHGKRWQSPLARTLEVDARTVRRWVAGDCPVSAKAAKAIKAKVAGQLVLVFIDQLTSAKAILGRLPAWPHLSLNREDYGWSEGFHTIVTHEAAAQVREGTGIHVRCAG